MAKAKKVAPVTDVEVSEPVDAAVEPPGPEMSVAPRNDLLPVLLPKPPETLSRTIRTFLWAILSLAPSVPTAVALFNLSAETAAKVGGVVAVLVTVVTFIVNALEESGVIPPILKK